jgi:hypothetical protein
MPNPRRSTAQIFLLPAMISLVVVFGLVSALLGDGVWDVLSWFALAVPAIIIVGFLLKSRFDPLG